MDGLAICAVGLVFVIALAALLVALNVQRDIRRLRVRYGELEMHLRDLRRWFESSGPPGEETARERARQRYLDRMRPHGQRSPESPVAPPELPEERKTSIPAPEAGAEPEPREVGPADVAEPPPPSEPRPASPPTTPYGTPYQEREERQHVPVAPSAWGSYAADDAAPSLDTPGAPPKTADAEPRPVSWEERLGANLFVWIGAVALALAGAFLVKFTFDRGLLSPPVRIILGLVFGAALVGAAEWMRKRSDRIAQGLAAAGIADLFACLWAAVHLYELISPMTGFFGMAAVTALAVVLSLRHGPFVAGLGLIGGFVTPLLVGEDKPQISLFAYLFFLELGLLAVTRRRSWWLLSGLTLLGGMGWTLAWLAFWFQPEHGLWLGLFLLGTTTLFVMAAQLREPEKVWGSRAIMDGLTWTGAMAGLLLVCLLVGVAGFTSTEWLFFGVLGAGCLALGRLEGRYEAMAWLAFGASAVMLLVWGMQGNQSRAGLDEIRYGWTAAGLAALYVFGAYGCQWRSDRQVRWAVMSVAAGLAFLLIAYWQTEAPPVDVRWGTICVAMAVLYAAGAVPLQRIHGSLAAGSQPEPSGAEYGGRITHALAAMLVGATAMVSLAIPIELERQWIAVAWALEVPALAALFVWLNVRALKTLGVGATALVVAYLAGNIGVFDFPIGENWPFNWLLYGYGVPIVALSVASLIYRKREDGRYVRVFEGAAILLSFVLITLEYQQYLRPGDMKAYDLTLGEWSGLGTIWLMFAMLLVVKDRWLKRETLQWGGAIASALAVALMGVMLILHQNPLFVSYDLGTRQIFNILLAVYGLPAVLLFIHAVVLRPRIQGITLMCGVASLVMLLMLITLEIRQFFHPNALNSPEFPLTEGAAVGIGWMTVAWLMMLASRRWSHDVILWGGRAVFATALTGVVVFAMFVRNPLWVEFAVGETILFNRLLPVYGLPVVLGLLGAWELRRQGEFHSARVFTVVALLLAFTLISLEVRQGFQGSVLTGGKVTTAEQYGYSLAWMVFGVILLVIGIATGGVVPRYASLAIMLLSVGKVFIIDTAHLEDLYRVFSFLGLGVSLLMLAFLYQKFVFRKFDPPFPLHRSGTPRPRSPS